MASRERPSAIRATEPEEQVTDETPETRPQTPFAGNVKDETPAQFKQIRESLHAEAERVKALALDWRHSPMRDIRDIRSPQLLGETLLRMHSSLGSLSERHNILEGLRG